MIDVKIRKEASVTDAACDVRHQIVRMLITPSIIQTLSKMDWWYETRLKNSFNVHSYVIAVEIHRS